MKLSIYECLVCKMQLLMIFISLCTQKFFFYRYWIFQSPKEKEIAEKWSKERKANKKRKKNKNNNLKQNTKSRTPKTSNIVRKIIIKERNNNTETWERKRHTCTGVLLKLWQFSMQTIFLKISLKWSRKLDFTLSINIHVWYKNFSQTLTFSLF